MKLVIGILGCVALITAFFLFLMPNVVTVTPSAPSLKMDAKATVASLAVPEAPFKAPLTQTKILSTADIPNQPHLQNPPNVIKGIYITAWSAGSASRINSLISLAKRTEINAVVVDIKDYSGYVSYAMDIPEVKSSGAENEIRIARPNTLIKQLHDNGIYVIGRITDFQDPILAKAHPEWAMRNKTTGKVWTDNKGLAWMDPAAKPVWDYIVSIAKDGFARGFDEMQFDYIRFASDGTLGNISYPYWDEKSPRTAVIANYFKFLRESLAGEKISADLFGLSTYDTWDDLGIGQVIEGAYKYFDYISPMVYPSHYAAGTLGYKNPAQYPYEVVKYSMDHALGRLIALRTKTANVTSTEANPPRQITAKLRPWLQDFNLGATYDASMVKKQIQATHDTFFNGSSSNPGDFSGWLLWNPANNYTEGALEKK